MTTASMRPIAGRARSTLLASTALLASATMATTAPTAAFAQDRPTGAENIAHSISGYSGSLNPAELDTAPNIVISAPGTPTTAQDIAGGVNGVG